MKKNIAFAFLVFGGILALSSCKDDDMEVYVGEDSLDPCADARHFCGWNGEFHLNGH